jgi:chromosome segregation ATPase
MGKHVSDLTVVSSETREAFQQMSGEVARTVDALDRGSQEMRSAIERLQAFHGEMQGAYSRMDDLFREAQAEAKQQVMDTLDATRAQQTQFGEATDRTMTALNAVSRHLTALADRLDTQSERLEGVRDTMLAAVSTGFRQTGAHFASELGPAIQLLGAAAGKLEAPVSTFQGLVERTACRLRGDGGAPTRRGPDRVTRQ